MQTFLWEVYKKDYIMALNQEPKEPA